MRKKLFMTALLFAVIVTSTGPRTALIGKPLSNTRDCSGTEIDECTANMAAVLGWCLVVHPGQHTMCLGAAAEAFCGCTRGKNCAAPGVECNGV